MLLTASTSMETVTSLIGNVLTLAGTALNFILENPVLAIGLGVSISGSIFVVIRKARHV
ncbi:MAG: hypothetical protein J6J11_00275 [Treponema sp.]|nr:hypothetical protein [Clostridia bacterium]MBP3606747.1 hypothetical protein [Treponema sp.]